jgi:hypothetical protein
MIPPLSYLGFFYSTRYVSKNQHFDVKKYKKFFEPFLTPAGNKSFFISVRLAIIRKSTLTRIEGGSISH